MTWKGGLKFEGTGVYGKSLSIDAGIAGGGNEDGYKPTELLLWGIAGCTGIDVVRILKKQRQELTSLEIEVVGHQNEDYPKPFHTIEVKYIATGKNLDKSKLAKAIELSEGKYCVVSQTVRQETKVSTSFEVLEG
jgi:putative redox protein